MVTHCIPLGCLLYSHCMTVSTREAAKALGHFSDWSFSNLQMQKILYLAHMFYMGRHQGEPLVDEHFEAWDYGPVLPSLYHDVKFFGSAPVKDVFFSTQLIQGREANIIQEAARAFENTRAGQLVAATHKEGGAWATHYMPGVRGIIIPNGDILREYNAL